MIKIALSICLSFIVALPLGATAQVLPVHSNPLPVPSTSSGRAHIIVEGETYTPDFYQGRAEPTAGNPMRLFAFMDDIQNSVTYLWEIDGSNYRSQTPSIRIIAPDKDEITVSLRVLDVNNNVLGSALEKIHISSPRVVFYEGNLLRGRKHIAIDNTYTLVGEQATIHAEPYFIGDLNKSNIKWLLAGNEISATKSPLDITLTRIDDTDKSYRVDFLLQNTERLLEEARNHFSFNFSL